MTIPELRKAMNHISQFAARLNKKDMKKSVKSLQSEWQSIFHKPLNEKLARDYLVHISKFRTSKTLKRGGGQIGYAPIDNRMEPGLSAPYGSFPDYVSKGFFVPMSDNIANCGLLDASANVPLGMGSNKFFGGRRRTQKRKNGGGLMNEITNSLSSIAQRPFAAYTPSSMQSQALMTWKGMPPIPGSQPSETTYSYRMPPVGLPPIPSAANQSYNAVLTNRSGVY
jgi:hypothetical protein